MSGSWYYKLGRMAGPKWRKGKWLWQSLTGSDEDIAAAEQQVGHDLTQRIISEVGIDQGSGAAGRLRIVRTIGEYLASLLKNNHRTYRFTILADPQPNAFAVPGGYIFITRSLLELCREDEDEIAFVLAHEIAHIVKGHAMDRLLKDIAVGTAARALPTRGLLGQWVSTVGIRFMQSAYSQDNEMEADAFGHDLMTAGGYDGDGALRLLQRLGQLTEKKTQNPLSVYLSTHPPAEERIRQLA